jgi:hypothetical protein
MPSQQARGSLIRRYGAKLWHHQDSVLLANLVRSPFSFPSLRSAMPVPLISMIFQG